MNTSIRDVIDFLEASAAMRENSVDGLEFGCHDTEVKGIATAFLATQEVIEEARALGVNLIISHEGIFFSHRDNHVRLQNNMVYRDKLRAVEESGLAFYRLHDVIHDCLPDAITSALLQALEWKGREVECHQTSSIVEIPEMPLHDVIRHIKERLGLRYVRFIGKLSMPCRRIGLLVGYRGTGDLAIPLCENDNIDLLIYGEGPEWETPEYIRDAVYQGRKKALIVLGHAESEMPGMDCLARLLRSRFPSVPVHFVSNKPLFETL